MALGQVQHVSLWSTFQSKVGLFPKFLGTVPLLSSVHADSRCIDSKSSRVSPHLLDFPNDHTEGCGRFSNANFFRTDGHYPADLEAFRESPCQRSTQLPRTERKQSFRNRFCHYHLTLLILTYAVVMKSLWGYLIWEVGGFPKKSVKLLFFLVF